jgi:hypothetical protein
MTFVDLLNAVRTQLCGMPRLDISKWITKHHDLSLMYGCFKIASTKWSRTDFFIHNRRDVLRNFLAISKPIVERGLPPTPSECSLLMGALTSISLLPHMQTVLRSFKKGDDVIIGGERFTLGSRSVWKAKHMLQFFRFVLSDSFKTGRYFHARIPLPHIVNSQFGPHTGLDSVIARDQMLAIIISGGLENVSFSGDEQKTAIQSGGLTPRGRVNLPPPAAPATLDLSKLYPGYPECSFYEVPVPTYTPLSTPRGFKPSTPQSLNMPTYLERRMEGLGVA